MTLVPSALTPSEVLATEPLSVLLAAGFLVGATIAVALALRHQVRRVRTLRHTVLMVTLAALVLGAVAAILAARLMLLDHEDLTTFVTILAVAGGVAVLLTVIVSRPLVDDIRQLEETVRLVEQGERSVHTGLDRNDELGHAARAIDDLVGRLDALERERADLEQERQRLLTSISHDLRTPLASLRAGLEAIADGVAADPARYVAAMRHEVAVLGTMIDDLFLLARVESGRWDLVVEPVDIMELCEATIEGLTPMAQSRDVSLAIDAPNPVRAITDPRAVSRVLRNLVDNAVEHAPVHGSVQVTVTAGDAIEVRVADDGPGIPDSFRDDAFEWFSRADSSRSRSTGGTGLGLAIARALVETLDGEIWIARPSRGTEIVVRLPLGTERRGTPELTGSGV